MDGFENFDAARRRGKGVLFLTGHMSAWELSLFRACAVRPSAAFSGAADRESARGRADQRLPLPFRQSADRKNKSARAILKVLGDGGTVGILADHNTSIEEGVFVDFFGIPASTTSGLRAHRAAHGCGGGARISLVGLSPAEKYRLRFEPAVELARTGDEEADVRENTQRFTRVIEDYVRAHPDQWLWVHKRWKTRPPGEKPIYPFCNAGRFARESAEVRIFLNR